MLVLGRKVHECVIIDQNIKIKVLEIRGKHVKLGFEAPKEVIINREEVEKEQM